MKLITIIIILLFSIKVYSPWGWIEAYRNLPEQINTWQIECYLDQLGIEETGNESDYPLKINYKIYDSPYHVINYLGCKGRWQQSNIALKDIGYTGTTKQFLYNKQIQKDCVIKYMIRTKYLLDYYVDYEKYLGKKRFGVKITFAGLIGASHLCGVGNVKRFLKEGYVASDGNRNTKDYLRIFSKYEFKI